MWWADAWGWHPAQVDELPAGLSDDMRLAKEAIERGRGRRKPHGGMTA